MTSVCFFARVRMLGSPTPFSRSFLQPAGPNKKLPPLCRPISTGAVSRAESKRPKIRRSPSGARRFWLAGWLPRTRPVSTAPGRTDCPLGPRPPRHRSQNPQVRNASSPPVTLAGACLAVAGRESKPPKGAWKMRARARTCARSRSARRTPPRCGTPPICPHLASADVTPTPKKPRPPAPA